MIEVVKKFLKFCKQEHDRKIAVKRYVISQKLIEFYTDLQISEGKYVDIPPCTLAYQAMRDNIKTDADVNRFYKKLELARLV